MALYRYIKEEKKTSLKEGKKYFRVFSFFLMAAGLFLIANVVYPIVAYRFLTSFAQEEMLSPLVEDDFYTSSFPQEDFYQVANWFEEAPPQSPTQSLITDYTLSIPELGIEEAAVKIGGEDLRDSLIHYGGTALPGEFGNVVIFGHSVLPQFFNPKNYLTIFSTLPTLEKGSEVFINFDGVEYKYKIYQMVEVEPEDVTVLEQRYDGRFLTLITCVPPGTYWKRLVVRGRLEEI